MTPSKRLLTVATLVWLAITSSHAATINFTSGEGYVTGNLSSQPSSAPKWAEGSPGTWQVNASAGTVSYNSGSSAIQYRTATFGEALPAAGPFTQWADFSVTRSSTTTSSSREFLFVGASGNPSTQWISASLAQMQNTNDSFRVAIYENVDAGSGNYTSTAITGSLLGFGDALTPDTSDTLRLSLTTNFVSGDNWATVATLENLTTSSLLTTVTHNWTATSAWTASNKYLTMNTGRISDLTGMSVTVDQVGLVPEPTALGLLSAAGIGLLVMRRRAGRAK